MFINPYEILGLDDKQATDDRVREAYREAVRRHPPDRDPEGFKRIRNAYELIDDEMKRIRLELFGIPATHLSTEADAKQEERLRVGPSKWLALIEEEAKRMAVNHPYEGQSS